MEKKNFPKILKILFIAVPLVIAGSYLIASFAYRSCDLPHQQNIYRFLYKDALSVLPLVGVIWLLLGLYGFYKTGYRRLTTMKIAVTLLAFSTIFILILISLSTARITYRDTRRWADAKQIQLALKMFYDRENRFPDSLKELEGDFMSQIPEDLPSRPPYIYKVSEDKNFYVLGVTMEKYKDSDECYNKVLSPAAHAFNSDLDGEILGVNCDDPVFCTTNQHPL